MIVKQVWKGLIGAVWNDLVQVEMVERLTTISVTVKAYSDKDTATKVRRKGE